MYPFLKDFKVKDYIFKNVSWHDIFVFGFLLLVVYGLGQMFLNPFGQMVTLFVAFIVGLYMYGFSIKTPKRTRLQSMLLYLKYATRSKYIRKGVKHVGTKRNTRSNQ